MRSRQTILSPLLRSFAALALVIFVAAQTLCFIHCNFGGGHGDSAQPSCHGAASASAGPDEGDSSAPSVPSPTGACLTLKTLLAGGDAPTLVAPQPHTLYLLVPFALALEVTATEPEALFSRQANHSDWVFRPEVSLGPAFRSLAPPFVS